MRLDKWLWQARFFKTRALAARTIAEGRVRLGGEATSKPHRAVGAGDVLTFSQGQAVRVVRVLALPVRRGPAPEAQALYDDMSPPPAPRPAHPADPAPREEGGRPSGVQGALGHDQLRERAPDDVGGVRITSPLATKMFSPEHSLNRHAPLSMIASS